MDNNFHLIQKYPTNKYQQLIHRTLQQCYLITDKKKIKYLIQQKPSPPTLKAQLKLHKTGIPIRPIINNVKAPTYKIAKHLAKLLNIHITLNRNTNNYKINAPKQWHTPNTTDNNINGSCSITWLFHVQNKIYQPEKGVSMGSPISSTITEIFLQHLDNIHKKGSLTHKT